MSAERNPRSGEAPQEGSAPAATPVCAAGGQKPEDTVSRLVQRKRDGQRLTAADMQLLLRSAASGETADAPLAALLMAMHLQGLDIEETCALARALAAAGPCHAWSGAGGRPVAGIQATGGVGDKTALIVVPLAACFDVLVPMVLSREEGGGVLEKLESIPGFRTCLSREQFEEIALGRGCAMAATSMEPPAAARRLGSLRQQTETMETVPLRAAFLLSGMLSAGLDALVVNLKAEAGSGAEMASAEGAEELVQVSAGLGIRSEAVLTDMSQPLGRTIGHALEVGEALQVLQGDGPTDLTNVSVEMAARMVALARRTQVVSPMSATTKLEELRLQCLRILADGAAWRRFVAMAEAQGAEALALREPERLPRAVLAQNIYARHSGYVQVCDAGQLGVAAARLGARGKCAGEEADPAAGIVLTRKRGQFTGAGEPLCVLHANDPECLRAAAELAQQAFVLGPEPPAEAPLVRGVVSTEQRFSGSK